MKFKFDEAKEFLKARNGGWDLMQRYLEDFAMMSKDLSTIQVSQLRKPYQEMVWHFSRVVGQELTSTVPRLALYILCFSIQEKGIFYWSKIILLKYHSRYQILERKSSYFCLHT